MNSEPTVQLSLRWWHKISQLILRTAKKGWIGLGVFALVLVLIALYSMRWSKNASLHFRLTHAFRKAKVSIWIDDDLTYSGYVTGYVKKKFGLIPEPVQGTMSQLIPVSSGQHRVRVRVEPEDGSSEEEEISGNFASHSQRDLVASARHSGVSLSWQAVSSTAEPSSLGSIGHYASWLCLTLLGSLISALTGVAVRELPGIIRTRQNSTPKP